MIVTKNKRLAIKIAEIYQTIKAISINESNYLEINNIDNLNMKDLTITLALLFVLAHTRKLLMIQQTFRHGARYPLFTEKVDHSDLPLSINSVGQLTTQGKNMHYLLGKAIYEQYWFQLFGGTPYENSYNQSQFYVKSTDVNRTIQSAQSHLFGLLQKLPKLQLRRQDYQYSLPPWKNLKQQSNVSETWTVFQSAPTYHPVAIHVQKTHSNPYDEGDFLLKYEIYNCPNQKYWSAENLNSDEFNKIKRDPRIKEAISALSAQIGKQVEFQQVGKWTDSDTALKYLGSPHLQVFQNTKFSQIFQFIEVYTSFMPRFYQRDQIRAIASNYIKQTIQNIQGKLNQTFTPRVVIYSAHDLTLQMILSALNMTNAQCLEDHYLNNINNDQACIWKYPRYASNIIFELWEDNNNHFIRIIYNGEVRKIPVCDYKQQCPLNQFRGWADEFVVDNVNSHCGFVKDQKIFYAVIFLLASLICMLAIYIVFLHARIKKIDTIGKAKKEGYMVNFEEKHQQLEQKN